MLTFKLLTYLLLKICTTICTENSPPPRLLSNPSVDSMDIMYLTQDVYICIDFNVSRHVASIYIDEKRIIIRHSMQRIQRSISVYSGNQNIDKYEKAWAYKLLSIRNQVVTFSFFGNHTTMSPFALSIVSRKAMRFEAPL